ncbi:MAG: hypothetical protein NTX59_11185 [Elusimicrobia bacterium]|nr:hypothetical protein [Elusimicrobiota bacterium]
MTKATKKQKTERYITIDYPKTNEVIRGGYYAVRISAPRGEKVEVLVDGSDWTLCRNEAGHWWFDLSDLADGEHKLAARILKDGEAVVSLRKFKISCRWVI